MAGNIKGITIEFRGDTTKLDKALRQINNETKAIDKELRAVDKALKFNPSNVDLWRQKQQLLSQKISETKEKLSLLKAEQARLDASGVDKNSEQYRTLQREIIETGSKLKTFETQLKQIGNVKLRALGEQFQQAGAKIESAGQKMMGVSAAAAAVTASIGALAYKSGKAADDINTLSKVTGIGTGELQKYSAAADLVDVSTETIAKSNTRLKKSMLSAQDGAGSQADAFKSLGVEVTNADGSLRDSNDVFEDVISALGTMENETERDALAMSLMGKSASELNPLIEDGGETYKRVADTLAKYDLEFVDQQTLNQANEFNDALDTMKVIGSVALQQVGTQLASYLAPALKKVVGWVGKFANWLSKLSPETLTVIAGIAGMLAVLGPLLITIGKISTGVGALIKVFGLMTGPVGIVIAIIGALIAIGILLYKNWDTIKATAIAVKTAVVTAFTNLQTSITNVWNSIKTATLTAWNNIKVSITNALNAIKTVVTTAWNTVKTATTNVWNSIKSAISNAINNAKTSVSNTVSSIKTTLSEAWSSIKERASSAWSSIKEKITSPFNSAKETISGIVDKIKGWFPIKIGNIFSGLKTPHFSLSWSSKDFGALGSISYPTGLNVGWWKTGGIFDSPSIIGVGEAGAEAVVPLDKFWDKLDKMQAGQNIVININGANKDPREIAEEVKRVLIKETNQRRLAWQ